MPRLREFGLPRRLLDQVPAFLETPSRERVLVHADHVFVDRARPLGIIDWGDAIAADRGTNWSRSDSTGCARDDRLLAAFLDGYGWPRDERFDAIGAVREQVDRAATLNELAAVFRRPCRAG